MNHPRPRDTGPVLHADDVDVVRDGTHLLRSITLQVHPGQHWALLGANGAGKSTLLSLLRAHRHPTGGSVEVLGHRLGAVDMRALRSLVGHVNPRHPLTSPLTVGQVVLTGATNTTELVPRWQTTDADTTHAERLISLLGIADRAHASWNTLFQGERGRALIARALMPAPASCCSTNPPPDWTWPPANNCSPASKTCAPNTPSWPPTTSKNFRPAPPTPCCCAKGTA